MNHKILHTLSITILLSLSSSILAIDSGGNYAVWGLGKKPCIAYLQAAEIGKTQDYKNYIMGYLTAYNMFTDKTYNISGRQTMAEILEQLTEYCTENQISSYESALNDFIILHYEKRQRSGGVGGRVGR